MSKLVSAAGESLKPFLPDLIPALVTAAGDLESSKLSYLSTALGNDNDTREMLDDMRANAARRHYTTDTVVKVSFYFRYLKKKKNKRGKNKNYLQFLKYKCMSE